MTQKQWLAQLEEMTLDAKKRAEKLNRLPEKLLNKKQSAEAWSALECIEHLNLYGDFYIPEMRHRITDAAKGDFRDQLVYPGFLGGRFAQMLKPNGRKMGSPKDKDPATVSSDLDKETITRFVGQQEALFGLLEDASQVNLLRTKSSISLAKWVKLRLGDTLRVVVFHNQRHLEQAERAVKAK